MLAPLPIASGDGFAGWQALNDTIMGGRSRGGVRATSAGLVLEAFVEPEGGGFVSCRSPVFDPRWVAEFSTRPGGTSTVVIPFNRLTPSVRATPVGLPVRFDQAGITRLQILHSKFGDMGGRNPGFRPGDLRLLIRSIEAVV